MLEKCLRQTEEALVAERRASAQQVVRACPAGVDVEGIGRLEVFSGDSDLNSRVNSMPWSQGSLTVWSYFGEFNQTATRLLQRVETNVEDPTIADNTTMTGVERRLSIQLYCALALTAGRERCKWSNKFPEVTGSRHGDSCAGNLDSILW